MPAHRTRILNLGQASHAGSCSCGWAGPTRDDRVQASYDANNHVVDHASFQYTGPSKTMSPKKDKAK